MNEKMKKFGAAVSSRWASLGKMVKTGIIAGIGLVLAAAVIVGIINATGSKKGDYITLFPGMSTYETAEVASILQANNTDAQMTPSGELQVQRADWNRVTLALAQKGYPKTTSSYSSFIDGLSMTMTDWEKKEAKLIALEQKIADTLRLMDGVQNAVVTLNIANQSDLVWVAEKARSTASVMLTLNTLSAFTNENVDAVKNLVAYGTQKMSPEDVSVIDSTTGKVLYGTLDIINGNNIVTPEKENPNSVGSAYTLEDQVRQKNQQIALEKAAANYSELQAIKVLNDVFPPDDDGKLNVSAAAAYSLDYDTVIREMTEYLTDERGLGVPTEETVKYMVDNELLVNDYGIVGEDENADIPTYVNEIEGDLTNSDATFYQRKTKWAIGQIVTQQEVAKGAVKSSSISVTVIDHKRPVLPEADRQNLIEQVSRATDIPVNKVSVLHSYIPIQNPIIDEPTVSPMERFRVLIWSIFPWLAGLALLIIILVIMLIAYGQRKTKREVRRAELESQAAIQSLQTTLDEHKRTLQEEVEAHQVESNSAANEVRDFVRENPEITAALIRSMLRNEN